MDNTLKSPAKAQIWRQNRCIMVQYPLLWSSKSLWLCLKNCFHRNRTAHSNLSKLSSSWKQFGLDM